MTIPVRRHVFADEAGNFDFSRKQSASKYFILCTVTLDDPSSAGQGLLELRRALAWDRMPLADYFHATAEKQLVRDEVFRYIAALHMRVDATYFEKCKAQPQTQREEYFYKLSWYNHFKTVGPSALRGASEAQIVAASIGTKKRRTVIKLAVEDVVNQCIPDKAYSVAFWPASSDPCLQIADYCTWAIQRALEHDDDRSRSLIQHLIVTQYDYFQWGKINYY